MQKNAPNNKNGPTQAKKRRVEVEEKSRGTGEHETTRSRTMHAPGLVFLFTCSALFFYSLSFSIALFFFVHNFALGSRCWSERCFLYMRIGQGGIDGMEGEKQWIHGSGNRDGTRFAFFSLSVSS